MGGEKYGICIGSRATRKCPDRRRYRSNYSVSNPRSPEIKFYLGGALPARAGADTGTGSGVLGYVNEYVRRATLATSAEERLNSWKQIAAFFLGATSCTVKRWEKGRGLPVHPMPGGARSGVFAYTSELSEWLRAPVHWKRRQFRIGVCSFADGGRNPRKTIGLYRK